VIDFNYEKNASIACKILENNKLRFSYNNAALYENDHVNESCFDSQLITASLTRIGFSKDFFISFLIFEC
jgi:hypothetical protein